jgi:hypothetical protein
MMVFHPNPFRVFRMKVNCYSILMLTSLQKPPVSLITISFNGGGYFAQIPAIWRGGAGEAGIGIGLGTNVVIVYEHSAAHIPITLVWPGSIRYWRYICMMKIIFILIHHSCSCCIS